MLRRPALDRPVHSVTSVPVSTADDQAARMRTYLVSMGVRTACFVIATLVFVVTGSVWATFVFATAAVVLPYPAVVWANNAGNRQSHFVQPAVPAREIGTSEDQHSSPRSGEHW